MSPLSYRLSQGTSLHTRGGGTYLVLTYPLKTIQINEAWRPVFERLAGSSFVPLDELVPLMTGVSRQEVSVFLNKLALKGFIDRTGAVLPPDLPSVSIIIPVHNRPQDIDACLTSLQQLDYPADKLEIIVVDDASDDHTPQVVEKHPVRLIRLKRNRQASYCRNLGARLARGDILAFIDSDCLADPLWLKQLIPAFNDPAVAAMGGRVDAWHEDKLLDRYEKVKSSLVISSRARRTEADDPFFYVPACNFLIRRRVFLEIKGFDRRLTVGEDVDLCWRLQRRGYALEYRPEGVVYHKHRNQLPPFCRRRFDYGTSEPLLQKIHPDKKKIFMAPPGPVGALASLLLWAITGSYVFAGIACLIPIIDCLRKTYRYQGLPIGPSLIWLATLRSYAAFVHHLCAFVSRYYLAAGILAALFFPVFALVIVGMHLLNSVVEYRLKKPALNFLWFTVFFTLEQLSYQAGVWWGCLHYRKLSPVLPKIVTGKAPRLSTT